MFSTGPYDPTDFTFNERFIYSFNYYLGAVPELYQYSAGL